MPTPYLIATATNYVGQAAPFDGGGFKGPNVAIPPFEYNGLVYTVGTAIQLDPGNPPYGEIGSFLFVSSSPDGQTFTQLNVAGQPQIKNSVQNAYPILDLANSRVLFACVDTSLNLKMEVFNLATGLWDTPIATGGPPVGAGILNLALYVAATQISATKFIVMYQFTSGGFTSVRVVTLFSGSWGTPFDLVTGGGVGGIYGIPTGIVIVPSSGNTFAFYHKEQTNPPQSLALYYAVIDNAGSASAEVLLSSRSGITGNGFISSIPVYVSGVDTIFFPTYNLQASSYTPTPPNKWCIFELTPTSAPVATIEGIADPVDVNDRVGPPFFFTNADASTYYLAIQVTKDHGTAGPLDDGWETIELWQRAASDTSWTGPTVFYDAQTDPPTGPTYHNSPDSSVPPAELNSVAFAMLSDGTTAGTIGMLSDVCGVEFYISTPGPVITTTLQLVKTVSGTGTAVPSDWTLSAAGATPISGAGGVGPADVDPDTYELSESAGPPDYTAGAWDCGEAEMPTATSVVVPSGEAVVCTINNDFNPEPPPPPPPPEGGVRVLRYQIPQRRWFPHTYASSMRQHYLDEPETEKPNDMQLLMLAGEEILLSGGNTDDGEDVTTLVYLPSNDGGDQRGQKLYVDTMVEADQTGDIISQVKFNNAQVTGPTVVMSPTGLREQFLENISSLADLSLYRNIMAILSWTGGPDGPRIYAFEPSGFRQPYVSTFFVTQYINLAYPGWKMGRRFYPAIISNADVLLTVETQDNRTYGPYTIPSTGGQFRILPMILDHGVKDLAFAFQLDGQGSPFALFPGEFVVEVKGWADPSFIQLAVFAT